MTFSAHATLQEILLSAWQALAAFGGRASVRTWLYRVATSRCMDALRSGCRRPVPVTSPPGSPAERELVERLTAAFESGDVDAITAMMTEDAWLRMPPLPLEYQGRTLAAGFLTATAFRPGWTARLVPARANGQPAFGFYARDPEDGRYYTVGLMVLTLSGTQVSAMTRFDPAVLPRFGLPPSLSS